MEAVLLVIHLIVAIGIVVTILVQPSESGGFMGNSGSMSNLMVQRRSGDVLSRATTILAAIFFMTSLTLAIIAGNRPLAKGILELDSGSTVKVEKAKEVVPDAPVVDEPKPNKKPVQKPK